MSTNQFTGKPALLLLLSALFLAASGLPVKAQSLWLQDNPHSKAMFCVGHDNIGSVTGWFNNMNSTLKYDGKNLKTAAVSAKIFVSSLNTGFEMRDQHLRSANFFDQQKYPEITFQSTSITPGPANKFKMTGDLTIRGKKKSVTLDCIGPKGPVVGDNEKTRIGIKASTRLNRRDFDFNWTREVSPGVFMVQDDVDVTLELEYVQLGKKKNKATAGR